MRLPLEGIRAVDLSQVYSLPYASGLMADLGAEVIKIEGPGRPDIARQSPESGLYGDDQPGAKPALWPGSSAVVEH